MHLKKTKILMNFFKYDLTRRNITYRFKSALIYFECSRIFNINLIKSIYYHIHLLQ